MGTFIVSSTSGGARRQNCETKKGDWAVHIFREHNKEADAWVEEGAGGEKNKWEVDGEMSGRKCEGSVGLEMVAVGQRVCVKVMVAHG